MGLFSRKKEVEIPEEENLPEEANLPELPNIEDPDKFLLSRDSLPNVPETPSKVETSSLPAISTSEPGEKFNQNVIKSAIKKPAIKDYDDDMPRTLEMDTPLRDESFKKFTKPQQPVYIRLDKFEATVQSLAEIKSKVHEIEALLKKVQEIKQREEQELNEWEKEIQLIKSRIDYIDRTIFHKVD